jgi:hypothetical protein
MASVLQIQVSSDMASCAHFSLPFPHWAVAFILTLEQLQEQSYLCYVFYIWLFWKRKESPTTIVFGLLK